MSLAADFPTCSDVIRRAARKMGLTYGGGMTVGGDTEDLMELLQSIILGAPGELLRGRFCDVEPASDYTAKVSERVFPQAPDLVITLPSTPGPYHRRPRDLSRVQIMTYEPDELRSPANVGLWLYVASRGRWMRADGLGKDDDFPFGNEDVEGFACQLAVAAFGEYGAATQPSARDIAVAGQCAASLRSRFYKVQPFDPTRPRDYPYGGGFRDYR